MKTLIAFVLLSMAGHAVADTCATLDYQEMKEMPLVDLKQEYCKAHDTALRNLDLGIKNLSAYGRTVDQTPGNNFDHCMNQVKRIERVLVTRGTEKVDKPTLCAK